MSERTWPSGRAEVVVVQESAEALLARDDALAVAEHGIDELVPDALVVPLLEVVRLVLAEGTVERRGPEADHAVEALILDRSNESLGVCVAVRSRRGRE